MCVDSQTSKTLKVNRCSHEVKKNIRGPCHNLEMTKKDWRKDAFRTVEGDELCFWRPVRADEPPLLHFAHATGFHAHTYAPLFEKLPDIPTAAWDMRGHGHSGPAGELRRFKSWRLYARDLAAWLEHQRQPVWLAGHSVGATVSAMVASRHPERVAGLILIEPVLMSRKQGLMIRAGRLTRRLSLNPLAAGALRRRNGFPSIEKVRRAYSGRGAFRTWPQEWLDSYIENAFSEGDDGLLHLRCDPRWESRSFMLTLSNPWDVVRKLKVPTTVLLGDPALSTTNADARHTLEALCPQSDRRDWPEATHFLPMEQTDAVADVVRSLVTPAAS